jgi:hypothetical protein
MAESPAAPAPPRPDPAKAMEERIRQAAEEGKRLAGARARERSAADSRSARGRSAEDLLRGALLGIESASPADPAPRRPERASEEEVDDLLRTIVGRRRPAKPLKAEPEDARAEDGEPAKSERAKAKDRSAEDRSATVGADSSAAGEEALDVTVLDLSPIGEPRGGAVPAPPEHERAGADSDSEPLGGAPAFGGYGEVYGHSDERSSRIRSKLIWVIIIIVFLASLAFILAGRAGAASPGPLGSVGDAPDRRAEIGTAGPAGGPAAAHDDRTATPGTGDCRS